MSDCHPSKISKTGGKCLTVFLSNFQKQEGNVRLSSWQIFKNGRKMSDFHPVKFSKTGGKWSTSWQIFKNGRKLSDCHPCKFSKTGGKCQTVILGKFQKREENVRLSFGQIFKNRREMSDCHPGKF